MKRFLLSICAVGVFSLAIAPQVFAQRGGGGARAGGGAGAGGTRPGSSSGANGGGARGGMAGGASNGNGFGGSRPGGSGGSGGFTGAARGSTSTKSTSSHQSSISNHVSGTGPSGGPWQAASKSGSKTTQNGGTLNYGGAAVGGSGPEGFAGGRYVGGAQYTTAGGQTINHVGRGGAATGPGGNTVGGREGASNTYGPAGSGATASRSGFATGANGSYSRTTGAAAGPNGVAVGRSTTANGAYGAYSKQSVAAVNSNGTAYGYGRSATAVTSQGTYHRSTVAVSQQHAYVQTGCVHYQNCFTPAWQAQYPGAWAATGWVAGAAWSSATYANVAAVAGYPPQPQTYDYGSNVVYQGDQVYANGDPVGTTAEYAQQATAIADAGKPSDPATDNKGDWTPLGVFAMVRGEETTSDNLFQLAINKDGMIRGNYYNALTDTTDPVYGSVDKDTQRAAWAVGDKKSPIYEAGLANLTSDQATMMVHYNKDKSQQFSLFRLEQPDNSAPDQQPGTTSE